MYTRKRLKMRRDCASCSSTSARNGFASNPSSWNPASSARATSPGSAPGTVSMRSSPRGAPTLAFNTSECTHNPPNATCSCTPTMVRFRSPANVRSVNVSPGIGRVPASPSKPQVLLTMTRPGSPRTASYAAASLPKRSERSSNVKRPASAKAPSNA